jgi:hypothetical protein
MTVRKLEETLDEAIAEVIFRLGPKKLPLLPSRHTMEMMAIAATAVYEAADENHRLRVRQDCFLKSRPTRCTAFRRLLPIPRRTAASSPP